MITFEKKLNGNYKGKSTKDAVITLFRVKDDYGTPTERWKWMFTYDDLKVFSEDEDTSADNAACSLAYYVEEEYGVEIEWEFREVI